MNDLDTTALPRVKVLALGLTLVGLASLALPARLAIALLAGGLAVALVAANDWAGWSLSHPFAYLSLALLLGVVGPLFDLLVLDPHEASAVLMGRPQGILVGGGFVAVVGVASLLFGYGTRAGPRLAAVAPAPPGRWDTRRATAAVGALAAIGLLAFAYVLVTINLGDPSSKRTLPTAYVRMAVRLLALAGLLALVTTLETGRPLRSRPGLAGLGLIGLYLLFGVLVSSRSTIIWTSILVLAVYVQYRRLRARTVLAAGGAFAVVSGAVLALRPRGGSLDALSPWVVLESVFGANRGHVVALSHLVEHVPGDIPFAFGSTLLQWIVFPIPRAIWPGKPVNVGIRIAREVYGAPNGTPPMLFGDLYLNFWLVGVLGGGVVVGVVLRTLLAYRNRHRGAVGAVLLCSVALLLVGRLSVVTMTMVTLGSYLVPLGLASLWIGHASAPEWLQSAVENSAVVIQSAVENSAVVIQSAVENSAVVRLSRRGAAAATRGIEGSVACQLLRRLEQGPER